MGILSASQTFVGLCLLLSPRLSLAEDFLVGYGNRPYFPICGNSCLQAFKPYLLNCSDLEAAKKPFDPLSPATAPSCYAKDTPFLTSVAWCVSTKCAADDAGISELEGWWEKTVTGSRLQPPKWTYSVALDNVDPRPPAYQLSIKDSNLSRTSAVVETTYQSHWNGMTALYDEYSAESKYGIILFVIAVGLPIVLSFLRFSPFIGIIFDRLKIYLARPLLPHAIPFLGTPPLLLPTLYLLLFTALNILLTALSIQPRQPNAFFPTLYKEVMNSILVRTGAFSFVLLPILTLFSARNNPLLWASNWSHTTFMVLHRWVGRLFMVHVVVHSILALRIYSFFENTDWWYWGVVGTVLTVAMVLGGGLYVRESAYQVFLAMHVVLAVLVIVGSWYHLLGWYAYLGRRIERGNTLGYEIWLYFAAGVWFFDRALRVGRMLVVGGRRAKVTELEGSEYLRVDVPGVRWGAEPGRHVFVHFPTVRWWLPWENHPFSVVPTCVLRGKSESGSPGDEEKNGATTVTRAVMPRDNGAGVTLFIRKAKGMTAHLKAQDGLLTFLDGPYKSCGSTRDILRCDRVLLIAGGIGITGVLPWAHSGHWNVKLAWSVREGASSLVDAVDLSGVLVKEIKVGLRFNIAELLAEEESAGWCRVGVVVCGPRGLCDDARSAVVVAGKRRKTLFELQTDVFSW